MTKYYFMLDKDDNIIGEGHTGDNKDLPADTPGITIVGITEQTAFAFDHKEIKHPGTNIYAFQYKNEQIVEIPDNRPTGTWSKTKVELTEGGGGDTVTLTLDTPYDGIMDIDFKWDNPIQVNFVNGVATIPISATKDGQAVFQRATEIKLSNRLEIKVAVDTIEMRGGDG